MTCHSAVALILIIMLLTTCSEEGPEATQPIKLIVQKVIEMNVRRADAPHGHKTK